MSDTKKFPVVLSKKNPIYPYDNSLISLAATKSFKICNLNLKEGQEFIVKFVVPEKDAFIYKVKFNFEITLTETERLKLGTIGFHFSTDNLEEEIRFSYELTYI